MSDDRDTPNPGDTQSDGTLTFTASDPVGTAGFYLNKHEPGWVPFDTVTITLADGGTVTVKGTEDGGYAIGYRDALGAPVVSPLVQSIRAGMYGLYWEQAWPPQGRPEGPSRNSFSEKDVDDHGLPDWAADDDIVRTLTEDITVAQYRARASGG